MCYTSTPPTPRTQGGPRKASVASIYEIGITQEYFAESPAKQYPNRRDRTDDR
jgi:hypothetical protein